jgi:hypothetical protein
MISSTLTELVTRTPSAVVDIRLQALAPGLYIGALRNSLHVTTMSDPRYGYEYIFPCCEDKDTWKSLFSIMGESPYAKIVLITSGECERTNFEGLIREFESVANMLPNLYDNQDTLKNLSAYAHVIFTMDQNVYIPKTTIDDKDMKVILIRIAENYGFKLEWVFESE